jgi:hypothetical protein
MGNVANWQLEPRNVQWSWCGRRQVVILTRWHWTMFDKLVTKRRITPDALHRAIWQVDPGAPHIGTATARYIEDQARLAGEPLLGIANTDTAWIKDSQGLPERTIPAPRPLPTIKWSPFKPIARATRVFA